MKICNSPLTWAHIFSHIQSSVGKKKKNPQKTPNNKRTLKPWKMCEQNPAKQKCVQYSGAQSIIAGGNAHAGTQYYQASKSCTCVRQDTAWWWSEPWYLQSFRGSTTNAWLKAYLEASCVRIRFLIGALEAVDTSSNVDTISLEKKVFTVLLMINILVL